MKLDALKFGLAIGIVWAGGVLLLGIMSALFNWGTPLMKLLGSLYLGYGATVTGVIVGALWALVDGFLGGLVVAVVYNFILGKK